MVPEYPASLSRGMASFPSMLRSRSHHPLHIFLIYLILLSFQSFTPTNFADAFTCTSPGYYTLVQPGDSLTLKYDTYQSDFARFNGITAVLYCMDIDGMKGGVWREIKVLFQTTSISPQTYSYTFTVPNCGPLARNGAIRLLAQGRGNQIAESTCQFDMKQMSVEETTDKPPPVSTTTKAPPIIPSSTSAPTPTKDPVSSSSTLLPSTTGGPPQPTTTGGSPLPPLPQITSIPTDPVSPNSPVGTDTVTPSGSSSPGSPSSPSSPQNPSSNHGLIPAIIGGVAVLIIVIIAIVLLVKRRRSNCFGSRGRSLKSRLQIMDISRKGSGKTPLIDGHFSILKDECDGNDDYDNPDDAPAVMKTRCISSHSLISFEAGSSEEKKSDSGNNSPMIQRPAGAQLHVPWRGTEPYIYSDDNFTLSSMTSSCETSSVVREYWAASMAARAERQQQQREEDSPFNDSQRRSASLSSQSRKADILSLDAASSYFGASGGSRESALSGAGGSVESQRGEFFNRHYRSATNSVHSYLRRSMSMSMASLRPESSFSEDGVNPGFRNSINADFLDHLNIKSIRASRQLEYYKYYYRQNPTMTTVDGSSFEGSIRSIESQRISSVPSLTPSTDPFNTFDSNEIILDMNPFSDANEITAGSVAELLSLPPPPHVQETVDNERTNTDLLRSFPTPPIIPSSSASTSSISSLELDRGSQAKENI